MTKRKAVGVLLALSLLCLCSCNKGGEEVFRKEYIDFYKNADDEEPSTVVSVPVIGGTSTFTVRSNVEFEALWQDDQSKPWASVSRVEKKGDDLYEISLDVLPRATYGYYTRRTGTLMFTCPSQQLGAFVTVHQGLIAPVASDFSWSKYGTSDPRKLDGTVYSQWIKNDKTRGWVLTEDAAVYGKNGYLMLGDATGRGASIYSPYYEGIRNDSLAVVSFRAVAFTDVEGVRDANKLTVEIIDGGVFRDNGQTKMELEAPYADITSEKYPADFWKHTEFLLGIISSDRNPFTGDTRICITAGDPSATSGQPNRIYIDNFYIRRIVEKNGDEDLWIANGGSGKDNLLGAVTAESND
ncbi:MAG: BACON domain-containing protein [Bacteroidales bacterium]|nr:BACON domain-containing protein [Bacteroidales bacterium]